VASTSILAQVSVFHCSRISISTKESLRFSIFSAIFNRYSARLIAGSFAHHFCAERAASSARFTSLIVQSG
jgi:hypothetical protein